MNNNPHHTLRTHYRTKFLHKPSSFSPQGPSVLADLPLPRGAFWSPCTGRRCLLPPSLAAFAACGDLTQSLIHKSRRDGSSSLLLLSYCQVPILLLLSPWCWGAQQSPQILQSPAICRTLRSQYSMAGKYQYFLGFLYGKVGSQQVCRKACGCASFTGCLMFNLSNEPKI